MAKLYPPYIEGTIPAFTGTTIVVPFSLNRANSLSDIAGFSLRIKTVQNNIMLATLTQNDRQYYDIYTDFKVSFTLKEDLINSLNIGQFYKVQLAFINLEGEVGYYSTVGIIKYTTKPIIEIANLKKQDNTNVLSAINRHNYNYTGIYSQKNKDTTEKLYSSRFVLTDHKDNIIVDSGEIIHNSSEDTNSYESSENYIISRELDENESYYLKYIVTTINKLVAESPSYRIMQQNPVHPDLQAEVTAAVNFEDGYIDVGLVGLLNKKGQEVPTTGSFILSRAASNTNWTWQNITHFNLQSQKPTRFLWRDFTVEQGVEYQYAVQQYSDNFLFSHRIKSPIVKADFEDAFLFDGTRQLKIRFNPKVSNFKNNIPEQKIDTIGSKYPFIFRNGKVHYKEFPISGLISYQMDDNKFFSSIDSSNLDYETTKFDLVTENIKNERDFKIDVLEWLNNGELKIFRSPTEGNYFVRLMNVSLTPLDSLGRMLHSFNCTAYEIYEYTYDNLVTQNFINAYIKEETLLRFATMQLQSVDEGLNNLLKSVEDYYRAGVNINFTKQQYQRVCNHSYYLSDSPPVKFNYFRLFESNGDNYYIPAGRMTEEDIIALQDIINKVTYLTGSINNYPVYSIFVQDMEPGARINIVLDNEHIENIQISSNGSYTASFENPVMRIEVPQTSAKVNNKNDIIELKGSITYGYFSNIENVFNTISDVDIIDVPIQQFIGLPSKTYYSISEEKNVTTNNLIEILEDVKKDINQIFNIKFYSRPIVKIYFQDNRIKNITMNILKTKNFYWDMDCTQRIKNMNELFPNYIYAICRARYDYSFQEDVLFEQEFIDATTEYEYFIETFDKYNGFYVDTFDNRVKLFTGYYLDGQSTNTNTIIFQQDSCTRKITINKDTIDITKSQKYFLPEEYFNSEIKNIQFNNGVICEISYQYSNITYSMEETDDLIKSQKQYYEKLYNYWLELHESTTMIAYNDMPGLQNTSNNYNPNQVLGLSSFVAYESSSDQLIYNIKKYYQKYVDYLSICLQKYREEHEIL